MAQDSMATGTTAQDSTKKRNGTSTPPTILFDKGNEQPDQTKDHETENNLEKFDHKSNISATRKPSVYQISTTRISQIPLRPVKNR